MYTLSTCVWCKKTKQFFRERNIPFEYEDIDLMDKKDKEEKKERDVRESRLHIFSLCENKWENNSWI
jgi:glutaredoxin